MSEPIPAPRYVYKVLSDIYQGVPTPIPSDWEFRPEQQDLDDGFIHLARAGQVARVLERHYSEYKTIMIVKVDYARMKAWKIVKWEKRGGHEYASERESKDADSDDEVYPHLYGRLTGQIVQQIQLLQKGNSWEGAVRGLEASGWLVE